MANLEFEHANMPHYRQLVGACGLAAVLMLVEPNRDRFVKKILDSIGKRIESAFPSLEDLCKQPNTRHQVAAAFMILKASISKEIGKLLTGFDSTNYEYIQEVITYELRKRMLGRVKGRFSKPLEKRLDHFLEKGTVDSVFLQEYTTRIKTDIELKLLMALFGYQFIRFPYSADATGSISLENIDFMIKSNMIKDATMNNYDEILEFMLTFLKVNFTKAKLLINTGFHWVAAKKIIISDERFPRIYYLDPGENHGQVFLLKKWKDSKNFYFFKKSDELRSMVSPLLPDLLGVKL